MTLARSDFLSATPGSAWWKNDRTAEVCSSTGAGVIASLQLVLRNALRGPWTSYDGTHTSRPLVDGSWGPGTNAALWAYLALLGFADRGVVAVSGSQQKISVATLRLGLWVAFYQPRRVDLDIQGERVRRVDQIPSDAQLLSWKTRPPVPGDLLGLGAVVPVCLSEQIADLAPATVPDLLRSETVLASALVPPVARPVSGDPATSGMSTVDWVAAAIVLAGGVWIFSGGGLWLLRGGGRRRRR